MTPHYVVSKLDSFGKRNTKAPEGSGGMLSNLHQILGNEWLIYNRETNETSKFLSQNLNIIQLNLWEGGTKS